MNIVTSQESAIVNKCDKLFKWRSFLTGICHSPNKLLFARDLTSEFELPEPRTCHVLDGQASTPSPFYPCQPKQHKFEIENATQVDFSSSSYAWGHK